MTQLQVVSFDVAIGDLGEVRTCIDAHARQIRARQGCLSYQRYLDNSGAVLIFQTWECSADFDAYRASAEFAALNASLKPLMIAPPSSLTYDVVARVSKVNG